QGPGQVEHADAAAGVGALDRQVAPLLVLGGPDLQRAAEGVRVRQRQRGLGAADLDQALGGGGVEAERRAAPAPAANSIRAVTCVGTSTANTVPAFGPEPITLVSRDLRAVAATAWAGPSSATSAV